MIGTKDLPEVARYVIRAIAKIKHLIAKAKSELDVLGKEIGMDEIKNDLNYLEEKAGKKNTELRVKIAFLKVKEIWEQAQPELQSAYNRLCA